MDHNRDMQGDRGRADMETRPESGFVIALCAIDRKIPIPQPRSEALNRYRFFLTPRRTDGREFFVLHMGTFATAAEAEKWLNVLRGTYPHAYVTDASGPGPTPPLLSDSQVLRVLEVRPPAKSDAPAAPTPVQAPNRSRGVLDKSLQHLAEKESDTGVYEALSDTGVRHLRIEVIRKAPKRPRNRIR
jgi:hypothetical protein